MAHTATAMSRDASGWSGEERSLDDIEDLDALADELRDEASETVVLYIEEDDEWLGMVRVTGDAEPKVFLSDRRALETSDLAERIFADALPVLPPPGRTTTRTPRASRPRQQVTPTCSATLALPATCCSSYAPRRVSCRATSLRHCANVPAASTSSMRSAWPEPSRPP